MSTNWPGRLKTSFLRSWFMILRFNSRPRRFVHLCTRNSGELFGTSKKHQINWEDVNWKNSICTFSKRVYRLTNTVDSFKIYSSTFAFSWSEEKDGTIKTNKETDSGLIRVYLAPWGKKHSCAPRQQKLQSLNWKNRCKSAEEAKAEHIKWVLNLNFRPFSFELRKN